MIRVYATDTRSDERVSYIVESHDLARRLMGLLSRNPHMINEGWMTI